MVIDFRFLVLAAILIFWILPTASYKHAKSSSICLFNVFLASLLVLGSHYSIAAPPDPNMREHWQEPEIGVMIAWAILFLSLASCVAVRIHRTVKSEKRPDWVFKNTLLFIFAALASIALGYLVTRSYSVYSAADLLFGQWFT